MHEGMWREAVVATTKDIAQLPGHWAQQLSEGVYLTGTGDTGTMMTFATLGLVYTVTMSTGAMLMKAPPVGWAPKLPGAAPSTTATTSTASQMAAAADAVVASSVSAAQAFKTPQFYLLWIALACNASAGVAIIGSAKQLMGDVFTSVNPAIVTATFTTGFVGALSVANATGRVGWAAVSDFIGRKNTMFICSLALPFCAAMPNIAHAAVDGALPGVMPLALFYGSTFAIVTWYGGTLSLVPSYCSDLFGTKDSSVIYGRVMTAWAASAIFTPTMLGYLRARSVDEALADLTTKVDPAKFAEVFHAPTSELKALIDGNVVTIGRLLEICPVGTIDPTPFLYDTTFYSMCGILSVAAVSNALITKVDKKHFGASVAPAK
jgi:hypothetical protein